MSFFRRKPLADINQQPPSPAPEGKARGFFSNKVAPQPLRPVVQKENDPTQAVLVQQHDTMPVQESNPPVKPATNSALKSVASSDAPSTTAAPSSSHESSNVETKSIIPPRPKLQTSGSASPLFRASFENRVSGKRPRDQAPKPAQPTAATTTSIASLDPGSQHQLQSPQPQQLQQQNRATLANEPNLKSPRKGSSRRSVTINPGLSMRGPSFEDSYNQCWDALESNREAMGTIRLDLMDARLLLANRCTDLLKEDVAPTLAPRLLDCMARVQEIRKRIGKPRPKTQYWPVAPPAANASAATQAPAIPTSA